MSAESYRRQQHARPHCVAFYFYQGRADSVHCVCELLDDVKADIKDPSSEYEIVIIKEFTNFGYALQFYDNFELALRRGDVF